jgi:hypothetical protein
MGKVAELFADKELVQKIQDRLPRLFQIAELESSRAGKIGMEVGSLREKVLVALLIHKFGEKAVNTKLPITEPEIDVMVAGSGLSIKTITGEGGIKAVWTVDAESSKNFINNYQPKCDILLVKIWWGSKRESLFLIPLSVQLEIFKMLGRAGYLNLPKAGTNPRGIEFSKEAIGLMLSHRDTLRIPINWQRKPIEYNVYERWVRYWEE